MNLSRRSTLVAGLASIALLAGCSQGASIAQQPSGDGNIAEVSIGVVPVVEMAPIYIAMDKGYFDEVGISVKPQVMQSAAAMIPSVMNGQLTFGTAAVPAFVSAAQQGLPIVATTGAGLYPSTAGEDTTALVVSKGAESSIQRLKDLEGKTVATNAINSGPYVGLVGELDRDGGDVSKVNFVTMPQADSMAAVAAGRVDATLLAEPFLTTAKKENLTRKFSAYVEPGLEVVKPGSNAVVIFSSSQYTARNAEVVRKFNQAIDKANKDADSDPQTIVDAMAKHSEMTKEVLEEILKPHFRTELDTEGLQKVADLMADVGAIPERTTLEGKVFEQ